VPLRTVRKLLAERKSRGANVPKAESPSAKAVRERLQRVFGTKVILRDFGGAVTITIKCSSYAELDEVMRRTGA
jgi:hypothetical protein